MIKRVFGSVLHNANNEEKGKRTLIKVEDDPQGRPRRFGIDAFFVVSTSDRKGASRKNRWKKTASATPSLSMPLSMSEFLQRGTESLIFSARLASASENWDKAYHTAFCQCPFLHFHSHLVRVPPGHCSSDDCILVFVRDYLIYPFVIEM
jgi:hypothetical protein